MIQRFTYLAISFLLFNCQGQDTPTLFSEAALNDTFINLEGNEIKFQDLISSYKGQTILVDVWASWCRDCIKGLPQLKELQMEYNDVVFLFLSLDKDIPRWKKGIKKHQIQGEHFYMKSGWNGAFGEFLNLDWIPRYLIVDPEGKIKLYNSEKISDKNILKALQ